MTFFENRKAMMGLSRGSESSNMNSSGHVTVDYFLFLFLVCFVLFYVWFWCVFFSGFVLFCIFLNLSKVLLRDGEKSADNT